MNRKTEVSIPLINRAEDPYVILVDENDRETGIMEKMEAHRKGVLHRAISVFIFNSKGEWLLQRRAIDKYHSRGLWTNTCCSHPYPGESAGDAAKRRLLEEMGMECTLQQIFSFIYKTRLDDELTEHELDHVFFGTTDGIPVINDKEVMEWKYIPFPDLLADVKLHPRKYTVWFRKILERVKEQLDF
jgi:isopentenyl-diphosphate Delta-isomerase